MSKDLGKWKSGGGESEEQRKLLSTLVDKIVVPEDIHILLPRICSLPWQLELCRHDQARDPEMGNDPGLSRWAQYYHHSPHRREAGEPK